MTHVRTGASSVVVVTDVPTCRRGMISAAWPVPRMGDDRHPSVVNADCRSWDIPNLWVCDGSVFPTTGGVNPSLTITSIAMRTADRIRALAKRGELSNIPPIRHARINRPTVYSPSR